MSLQRPSPAVGENIAELRKLYPLTQEALARKAGISVSHLSKIEIGDRVASPPVVAAIARALDATMARLYYGQTPNISIDLDPIRTAVRCYDIPDTTRPPVTPVELAAALTKASEYRAGTQYDALAVVLPGLLADATGHAIAADDPEAWAILADVYGCAYTLAHRLGHPDLADAVTARQEWATTRTYTPVAHAVSQWNRAGTFQSAGDYTHGLDVVENAVSALSATNLSGPAAVVARGSLHLRAVTLASRAKDRTATDEHLRHATSLAERLPNGDDRLIHNLTFGAGNTALHRLAAYVELDEPERAVDMAATFVPGPGLKRTRLAHFHIDTARAHLATNDRDAAFASIREADRIAPQMAGIHPMAREVVRVLVSKHRRSNPGLLVIAEHLGIFA